MNQNEQRFLELMTRVTVLKQMQEKLKEAVENEANQLFAKMMGDAGQEAKVKQTAMLAVVDKWIKEVEAETADLEDKVFNDFMQFQYDDMSERLKNRNENKE